MGRTILTDAAVRRIAPPAAGRLEVWDAALPGFGVRITERGHRSFVLVTRLRGGKPIRLTVGAYPALRPAVARELARDQLQAIARGEDPRTRKHGVARGAAVDTVAAIADDFLEKYARPNKRSWRAVAAGELERADVAGRALGPGDPTLIGTRARARSGGGVRPRRPTGRGLLLGGLSVPGCRQRLCG